MTYCPQHARVGEALHLLQRQMNFGNSNNPLIHSAFLYSLSCASNEAFDAIKSIQNQKLTLCNYFNLGLLFRKKGQYDHAYYIFSDLVNRIEVFFSNSNREVTSKDLRLLILSKINLVKIRR